MDPKSRARLDGCDGGPHKPKTPIGQDKICLLERTNLKSKLTVLVSSVSESDTHESEA